MKEAEELRDIESEKGKERQGARTDIVSKIPQGEQGKTRDNVAKAIGIGSGSTYERAKKLWEAAEAGGEKEKDLITQIDIGEETIGGAYKVVEKEKERKPLL